jgi:hypothetical protein
MKSFESTDLADRMCFVPLYPMERVMRLLQRRVSFNEQLLRCPVVGSRSSLYKMNSSLVAEIYKELKGILDSEKQPRANFAIRKALTALESSVLKDSRESLLGVRPQLFTVTRKPTKNEIVRVYIHTLDNLPAVFKGNTLEHAEIGKSKHYEMPRDLATLRREQRAVLKPLVDEPVAYQTMKDRMSYVSFVTKSIEPKYKEQDIGSVNDSLDGSRPS